MKRFSRLLKKIFPSFTPSQAPQPAQDVSPLDHQAALVLPYAPTLGRLADSALQAEAKRCLAIIGEKPTDEQWDMILASTTSTAASAGAGSGKSTTLILRLLIMHKLLGIPLDEMHVFSFTNASVRDFRGKLRDKLIRWEEVIEQQMLTKEQRAGIEILVERTVSTFHSVLYRLQRDVLPGLAPSTEIFDTLKDEKFSRNRQSVMTEEDLKSENPFLSATLSAKQDEVLKAAHERAFEDSLRYQELMKVLREEQDRLYWLRIAEAPTPEGQIKNWFWDRLLLQERFYHGFDPWEYEPRPGYSDSQTFPYVDPYRAAVANWLIARGVPFVPLVSFFIPCPIPGVEPGEFFASFQIDDQLFLHVERYSAAQLPLREDQLRLAFHERDRRRFIAAYSGNTDQHKVLKVDDFVTGKGGALPQLKAAAQLRLRQWIHLRTNALPLTSAPALLVRLPGDIREGDIKELLYQEGMFIESMGGEVEQFQFSAYESLDSISLAIAEALPLFWSAFREELKRWRYIRYHDILSRLRDEETLGNVLGKLKHLRHLFIDEFQDISPEIVDWLAKTLHAHVQVGAEVSVIAIGDDYQSIYGWRGSHPTFLMHFDRYFPSPSMGRILLTDNFRSRQPIIDAAEAVLVSVQQKTLKQGRSVFQGREPVGFDPVYLVEAQLSWNTTGAADIWSFFCTYVGKLLHDLEERGYLSELVGRRQELSVYILARTNATRRTIPDRGSLKARLFDVLRQYEVTRFQQISMRTGTFHQSKGLEADVVLLLDDPQLPDEHPLRELVFSRASVLGQVAGTYKQTMADETYRLAYVALTRARLAVMWIPLTERKNDGDVQSGANDTGQAHAAVSTQGCFVLVKNFLQAMGRLEVL